MYSLKLLLLATISLLVLNNPSIGNPNPKKARKYLKKLESIYSSKCHEMSKVAVKFFGNVTDENEEAMVEAETEFMDFQTKIAKDINKNYPWYVNLSCPIMRKEFKLLTKEGNGDLDSEKTARIGELRAIMSTAYSRVTMCEYKNPDNCTIRYDTVDPLLRVSRDFDECAHYVTEFHNAVNKVVLKETYIELVNLNNEASIEKGYKDTGELWMSAYDDESPNWTPENFRAEIDETWKGLKPYYMKMHAYVRMKLVKFYGDKIKDDEGHIKMHVLSDMWAQDWIGIESFTKPFPDAPSLDSTEALQKAGYTVEKMFHLADEFFQSMGLYKMNDKFWELTQMTRPDDDREVLCAPMSTDLCIRTNKGKNGQYRVGMCAIVNHDYLGVIHHEMGHTQYQMQYSHHHWVFRMGSNPGFHEAIGDSLALAVLTPKHLECVLKLDMGLGVDCGNTSRNTDTKASPTDINQLYLTALAKLVFLPFAYSVDSFRWDVFAGKIEESEYNTRWWEIRKENQGIIPPGPRPEDGFDAGAKYHVVADVGYIRYFVSYILTFQFYEAMCIAAGEFDPEDPNTKPLYQCDFTGSTKAGTKFGDMLKLGRLKPWPDALEMLTGSRSMSPTPMLNYFKPLFDQMDEELKEGGESPCFGEC